MLNRLEGFVAIAEHGQLSRAAAALHLTQPSLTARLQRLEAELATPLFRRTRQGMQLTPQGEALLPHARRALEAVAEGRRALDGSEPAPGRLALGAAPAVSTYVLPALLERLRRDYPSIALSVRTGRSEDVLEMVLAGDAQIGLVRALRHPAIEAIPFYQEELVLVCAPDHPLAIDGEVRIEQLGGEELVLFDRSSSYHELTGALFRSAGVVPRGVMELDNIDAAKQMVRRGLGVALLPYAAVAGEIAEGVLGAATIVGAPAVRRQIVAIRRRGAPYGPFEAAFLAALPDAIPSNAKMQP
ncbi:MAG TPA: LysR family transcriptional regulator [Gaiellales bacterium]|jgi:DNA-binding transcriptional LysR family regulator